MKVEVRRDSSGAARLWIQAESNNDKTLLGLIADQSPLSIQSAASHGEDGIKMPYEIYLGQASSPADVKLSCLRCGRTGFKSQQAILGHRRQSPKCRKV